MRRKSKERMSKIRGMSTSPYHLVDISPWPIIMSISFLFLALILCNWLTHKITRIEYPVLCTLLISLTLYQWFRDIVREGQGGYHTKIVQQGIFISFLIFLATEIMLFFSFFWAFFHSSLAPNVELGCVWPPLGLNAVSTWALPLFGTTLLLSSGFILTLGHHALIKGDKSIALFGILSSVILGALFAFAQFQEYTYAEFTIADSIFGSIFYLTTGLHFLHVVAGVVFLAISGLRLHLDNLTSEHHLGLEFAIFYWHLVDIVWLAVYIFFYYWGGL